MISRSYIKLFPLYLLFQSCNNSNEIPLPLNILYVQYKCSFIPRYRWVIFINENTFPIFTVTIYMISLLSQPLEIYVP